MDYNEVKESWMVAVCKSKYAYDTKHAAAIAAKNTGKVNKKYDKKKSIPYKCEVCNKWHIGRKQL